MNDRLFADDYAELPDFTTCVTRMPGTADAPCACQRPECLWPWCVPPKPDPELQPEEEAQHVRHR